MHYTQRAFSKVISSRQAHFQFLGALGGIFLFFQVLIEHSERKQQRPGSDTALSGSALFAFVP